MTEPWKLKQTLESLMDSEADQPCAPACQCFPARARSGSSWRRRRAGPFPRPIGALRSSRSGPARSAGLRGTAAALWQVNTRRLKEPWLRLKELLLERNLLDMAKLLVSELCTVRIHFLSWLNLCLSLLPANFSPSHLFTSWGSQWRSNGDKEGAEKEFLWVDYFLNLSL